MLTSLLYALGNKKMPLTHITLEFSLLQCPGAELAASPRSACAQ